MSASSRAACATDDHARAHARVAHATHGHRHHQRRQPTLPAWSPDGTPATARHRPPALISRRKVEQEARCIKGERGCLAAWAYPVVSLSPRRRKRGRENFIEPAHTPRGLRRGIAHVVRQCRFNLARPLAPRGKSILRSQDKDDLEPVFQTRGAHGCRSAAPSGERFQSRSITTRPSISGRRCIWQTPPRQTPPPRRKGRR
ncbi:hypothetical protein PHO31112_02597 [Pandoraea horticolens]|uniref:Uncharacterized protein n=1 Tax=Pandoraea horticolens TaxID=2508298 RepID=A0A5E4VHA1_9BURK|nr:hypothetical protein PHO31112_02597 [Pandoraea horticolens]